MTTANKSLAQPANGSSSWDTPLNSNFGVIDAALGTLTYINVTSVGSTPVTLTDTQYQKMGIVFTGTPSANLTYNFPAGVGGNWIIADSTTGGSSYSITLGSLGAGSTLAIPRGKRSTVFCDTASVLYSDDSRPIPPGSNTQVIYNSSGSFAASANFTFDGNDATIYRNINISTGNVNFSTGGSAVTWGNTNIQATISGDALIVTNSTTRFRSSSAGYNTSYGSMYVDTGNLHLTSTYSVIFGSTLNTYITGTSASDITVYNSTAETARFFGTNNFSVGVNSLGSYAGSGAIAAKAGYLTQPGDTGGFTSPHVFNINWTGTIAELWIDTVNLGQISTSSDRRIKQNIYSQTSPALSRIMALRPVVYEMDDVGIFKADGIQREGFIADELQPIIPSAVSGEKDATNKDGAIMPQSLNWAPLMSVAVKAIQEMKAEIDELRIELAALKGAK